MWTYRCQRCKSEFQQPSKQYRCLKFACQSTRLKNITPKVKLNMSIIPWGNHEEKFRNVRR